MEAGLTQEQKFELRVAAVAMRLKAGEDRARLVAECGIVAVLAAERKK
jgi:hypothetical protein